MLSRRRRQKLSAVIIHECPAIGRDVRLGRLDCYFGSRVLRKYCASESPYKRKVSDDTGDIYLPRKIDARRIKPVIKIIGR